MGEVGCVCVVWCCCCKSIPSYFLIPSIAVLFVVTGTRHHQPRPCSAVYLPDQQHRQNNSRRNKRGHDSSQQASTPPSAARRVPSVFAGSWLHPRPGWIALLRCSVAGAVVVRQPAAVPKHEQWQMSPSRRVTFRSTGGEKWVHENDETRKKGSTDSGLRSILTVTCGRTFFFFAPCRPLAAAWRVRVAVVSSQGDPNASARSAHGQ